jgi:hypothetical protein
MDTKLLHRPKDVMRMLSIGETTFWMVIRPKLDVRHIGNRTYITDESLREYVANLPKGPAMARKLQRTQSKQEAA